MPRRKKGTPPSYCLHRQSGRAFVRLNGRQIMLGKHGSQESRVPTTGCWPNGKPMAGASVMTAPAMATPLSSCALTTPPGF